MNNNFSKKAHKNKSKNLPIGNNALAELYSLRNCPYAMRARIAIFKAEQTVLLRDIVLSNKPIEMTIASPKATVPVLILSSGKVIDESLAVMLWALRESDPSDLLHAKFSKTKSTSVFNDSESDNKSENANLQSDAHNDNDDINSYTNGETSQIENPMLSAMLSLIDEFDQNFKTCLEQYKCAKRYKEDNIVECREVCEQYLQKLEQRLTQHTFLMSDNESLADIALLPFIRQFARVERQWYLQSPYPHMKQWLSNYLQSPMFTKVMAKYPLWLDSHEVVYFGQK